MPDLETRLRAVDRVTPPDVWGEADARFRRLPDGGTPLPTPPVSVGQRVAAAAVALAVFAAAGVFSFRAFDGDGRTGAQPMPARTTVTFTFEVDAEADTYPSAHLSAGGNSVRGRLGSSYIWEETIVDIATPKLEPLTAVPAGASIAIQGNADTVRGWVDSCCFESFPPPHLYELDLSSGDAKIPEEGDVSKYVLEFRAEWPQGTVTYLWPVQVVLPDPTATEVVPPEPSLTMRPEPSDAADVAVVLTQPTGEGTWPTADVTVQRSTFVAGPHDMAGWGQEQAFDPDADRPLGPLPPGATLEVLGDPSRVFGTVRRIFDDGSSPRSQQLEVNGGVRTNLLVGPATFPSEPGSYRLVLSATWGDVGEAVFAFTFDVSDETPPDEAGTPEITRGDLVGTSWELSMLDGAAAPFGDVDPVTIRFEDVYLGIDGACNSFGGRWDVEDGRLETREIVGTLIGCKGLTDQIDDRLIDIIGSSPVLGNGGVGELRLTSNDGVAIFTRVDVEDPAEPQSALDCLPSERSAFELTSNVVRDPALPSYITVNVEGINRDDDLVLVSGSAEGGEESVWHVRREGLVQGVVNVPELDGWACKGSGIGGL